MQRALDRLQSTTVPQIVIALSNRSGEAPTTCTVVPAGSGYRVYLAWQGLRPAYRTVGESLVVATIGTTVKSRQSTWGGSTGVLESPATRATLVRVALARPAEQCEVLQNGRLQLVPRRGD